jgi:pimeloyl-ACP methyl ester carboxylesterase
MSDNSQNSVDQGFERRTADAGGGRIIHYLDGGEGAPLLVLHAAGGGGDWLPFHAALARRFRIIAPDHPGFSNTPEYDGIDSIQDLAFVYRGFLDALGLSQLSVLGISLGGWLAAELALIEPQRVANLVLVNAVGLRVPGHPIADLFAMNPAQKGAALFHDQNLAAQIFGVQPDIDTIIQLHRNERAFARYAWQPYCCNPKLAQRLPGIRARTLVLCGSEDKFVPLEHGKRYAAGIPKAQLHIVPNAGHALLHEEVDAGVEAAVRFLSQ